MKFEIKNRFSGSIQFTCELDASFEGKETRIQLGAAIKIAIKDGANLDGANLDGANLDGANLYGANLVRANLVRANLDGANLVRANLDGANLYGANLYGANLDGANLDGANLYGANLDGANLDGANLDGANLVRANLYGANLYGANLYGANLDGANLVRANLVRANLVRANLDDTKEDFVARLLLAKNEVLGLYDYLMKGKINGSSYSGECACFCGTIANVRKEIYSELTNGLKPDADSPTEKLFLAIKIGDIPQNNQVSALVATWMREFMDKENIQYPNYEIVAIAA